MGHFVHLGHHIMGEKLISGCIFLWGNFVFLGCLEFVGFLRDFDYVVLWDGLNDCGYRSLRKMGSC